ncbi:hypothetical protein [Stenotrophomonas tuberculopleuritidis]|uniref:hypothetical protein n=1 Tax=Stenotrophomonas tuberculopleuritidis TaxID=3055079 RepID=UPI0026E52618|nr:hypothetical protein [Stenotrophomonas sp. 704A1]
MAERVSSQRDPCEYLCADLMDIFRMPLLGMILEDVRVAGRSSRDVKHCLTFLCDNGLLDCREVRDASGKKFTGVLISTTSLGTAALAWLREQRAASK